jgi:hypothetical protein
MFFVKEARQFFAQVIRLRSEGDASKQPIEEGLLFRFQVLVPLSQGQHAFQLGVFFFREDCFELLHLDLAQCVNGRAIEFGKCGSARGSTSSTAWMKPS